MNPLEALMSKLDPSDVVRITGSRPSPLAKVDLAGTISEMSLADAIEVLIEHSPTPPDLDVAALSGGRSLRTATRQHAARAILRTALSEARASQAHGGG